MALPFLPQGRRDDVAGFIRRLHRFSWVYSLAPYASRTERRYACENLPKGRRGGVPIDFGSSLAPMI